MEKKRSITVFYRPAEKLEPKVYAVLPGDKAGYFIHSDDHGIIGYRFFINEKTVLIPKEVVLDIEVIL